MSLLFRNPGILTTVQDLGRHGYRRFGINPGGAMDVAAARLINVLLGNNDDEAVLEMHFPAPRISFEADAVIAIGGADFSAFIGDQQIENWRRIFVAKGSELKFTDKISGNCAYLAIGGGFKCEPWLNSMSTNLTARIGGFHGRPIAANDRLYLKESSLQSSLNSKKKISPSLIPMYRPFPTARIVAGAEFEDLSVDGRDSLLNQDFAISRDSNRMGFRLIGKSVKLSRPSEFVSSAMSFGTIEILPDGQLIVLMADHQTAGGYPRVGHVITRDLPLLAQLGPDDRVAFHLISIDEAERLAFEFENELNFLRVGCKLLSTRKA